PRETPPRRSCRERAGRTRKTRSASPLHTQPLRNLSHPLPLGRKPPSHLSITPTLHPPGSRRAPPHYSLWRHLVPRRHHLPRIGARSTSIPRLHAPAPGVLLGHQHHARSLLPGMVR